MMMMSLWSISEESSLSPILLCERCHCRSGILDAGYAGFPIVRYAAGCACLFHLAAVLWGRAASSVSAWRCILTRPGRWLCLTGQGLQQFLSLLLCQFILFCLGYQGDRRPP